MIGSYASQLDGAPELASPLHHDADHDAVDTEAEQPDYWLQIAEAAD